MKLVEEKGEDGFHEAISNAGLQTLTPMELRFVKEYVHVMQPVAYSLALLQRDKDMYLGYILPTVFSMEANLRDNKFLDGKPLKYCTPMLNSLLQSIRKERRFGLMLQDKELILAACLIPKFKLDGIKDSKEKEEAWKMLLAEMSEVRLEAAATDAAEDSQHAACSLPSDAISEEDRFFRIQKPQRSSEGNTSVADSIEAELDLYLKDTNHLSVQDCYLKLKLPRLKKLFLKFNTALPTSAMVERWFSLVGNTFGIHRSCMADDSIASQTLLNANFKYINWDSTFRIMSGILLVMCTMCLNR